MMKWLKVNMETITLGYVALPNVLFITYFLEHFRAAVAALPVILFYVMVKTTPYALRAFGRVLNPLRLLRESLIIAIFGALLALVPFLVVEGAILVGIGLATVPPAYQQCKDYYKDHGQWEKSNAQVLAIGALILALMLGFILARINFAWFVLEFLVILAGAALFSWKLPSPWATTPTFSGPYRWQPAISTILIFVMTLGARGLKQTGARQLIWLTLIIWVVMLFGFNAFQQRVQTSRLWTFLTGATVNFLLIYGLFYFSALGNYRLLYAAYILYVLGMIAGQIVIKPLRQRSWVLTAGLLATSLIVVALPSRWCYLAGTLLASCCCSVINTAVWPVYANNANLAGHARFVRQYFTILGSIISQVTLVCLLILTNLAFDDRTQQLLAAYYRHQPVNGLNYPLWLTRAVCAGLLLVVLAVASVQQHRHHVDN